ncbi:hypothetical protein GOP47_0000818 [Adiantum capillus-veneris]|uniref:Essential protein Yae1 N-terminal domain-containing protein n=1 Tax=Adiantum capillus-veneris TaxID=13818 RepID=A0A9D4VEL0_ADICA|nr:hypothetical protein GOP47_0000818 [Adiantum capillus-veneris]
MARQAGVYDDDEEAWDLADEDVQEGVSSSQELDREWSSRHTHFHTLGYRDGIEEGKKTSVQQGFDAGYSQGVKAGLNCGLARGWAGAFIALPPSMQSLLLDDTQRKQVDEVHTALSCISSDKAALLYYDKMQGDMKASDSKADSSTTVETLQLKLQSVLQSLPDGSICNRESPSHSLVSIVSK